MAASVVSESFETKSDKDDWYDGDVADCIVSISRKASLYELVLKEGVEEVDSLVKDKHKNAETKVFSSRG